MNASGPEAPCRSARTTCPTKSSIMVVRVEVAGLSGVMGRSKDRRRGYSHPGTHVPERKLSELSSSHSMIILGRQYLVTRMSYCAASDWFTEEAKARLRCGRYLSATL